MTKTVFETTAQEVTEQILVAAAKVAETLPVDLKKFAVRKIQAARKSGTLPAAYKAGRDIQFMAEGKIK